MKEQRIVIKLNISGINDVKTAGILAKDSLGKDWVVKRRDTPEIALVEDHFVMYRSKYGETIPNLKETLELISSYSVNIISAPFGGEDIHLAMNLLETLRKNGAVCIRSILSADIIKPEKGPLFNKVKEELANSSLMLSMFVFEPLQHRFISYYTQGDTDMMNNINLLVKKLLDDKSLDILLDGMKTISNTPLTQLNFAREVANAIW